MTAPVVSDVIAFSAISETSTASRYGPWYAQRPLHDRHHASVRANAESASSTGGVSSNEACQVSVSRSRAPSTTTKSAVTVPSRTSSSSGVLSRNASGPAVAIAPSDARSVHGVIDP